MACINWPMIAELFGDETVAQCRRAAASTTADISEQARLSMLAIFNLHGYDEAIKRVDDHAQAQL